MPFLLNSENIFDYLVEHQLAPQPDKAMSQVEPIAAKNFNLLVIY
ncbi:hypothetical protein [Coleofasciculus sp. E2-BRE-01]